MTALRPAIHRIASAGTALALGSGLAIALALAWASPAGAQSRFT